MNDVDLRSEFRPYADRVEAGERLAEALIRYEGRDALVLGIPRGGVPVAAEVARGIGADLDVVVARKLGAPMQPELAIGAVTANGGLYLDEDALLAIDVDPNYLNAEIARQSEVARQRETLFRGETPPPRITDRTVLVVDDGLATGATMRAALRSVAKRQPAHLIAAVPVGPGKTRDTLREEADEVVCLLTPEPFWAVGLYYQDFAPVEDDDVSRILARFRPSTAPVVAPASVST